MMKLFGNPALCLTVCLLWQPLRAQFSTVNQQGTLVATPDKPIFGLKIYGAAPGQVLAVGPDGTVVGKDNPWLSAPPAPFRATSANFTSLATHAVNYSYNAAKNIYAANYFPCAEWLLPGGTRDAAYSGCIVLDSDLDYYPGFDYGWPGTLSSVSSFGHQTQFLQSFVYSAGNHTTSGLTGFYYAPGDINVFNVTSTAKQAWIAGSDEGFHSRRETLDEAVPFTGSVESVTAAAGGMRLTLKCQSGCNTLSLMTPLIDLSSGVLRGTISGIHYFQLPLHNPQSIASVTTSYPVPVSTEGTLASAVDVVRAVPNDTLELSAATLPVDLKTSTPIRAGDLISVMGPAFYEVVKVAAAPDPPSGGVQKITAVFRYSHPAGTTFCVNGAVGSYLELSNYTAGDYRYLENVMCSPSAHTLWIGHQSANTLAIGAAAFDGIKPGPVVQYQGADIVGVLNAKTDPLTASNGYVALGDGPAVWHPGDRVENTNHISAFYTSDFGYTDIKNPWAARINYIRGWLGRGGGLNGNGNGFFELNGPDSYADYPADGSLFKPPWGMVFQGALSNTIAMQYAPMAVGGSGAHATGCASGWVICIGQGPVVGQAARIGLFYAADINASLTLDHSNGTYNFDSAAGVKALQVHGSTVCTASSSSCGSGYPVTADITLTAADSDTFRIDGVTGASKCNWGASNAIAAGVASALNAYYTVTADTFVLHHAAKAAAGATYGVICSVK